MNKSFKTCFKLLLIALMFSCALSAPATTNAQGDNVLHRPSGAYLGPIGETDTQASDSVAYYFGTGTECPSRAKYTKYKLLETVKKGDIVFEPSTTGHVAIVEGIFVDRGRKYIRVIEALPDLGVTRSILDDKRMDDKKSKIYRPVVAYVKSGHGKGSTAIINGAVDFCISQLGKPYTFDFKSKSTDTGKSKWFCSELVWAAYMRQGMNFCPGDKIASPRNIINDKKVKHTKVGLK